jgi:hypothetical protein
MTAPLRRKHRNARGNPIGESHYRAKLTTDQVHTIRRLHATGTIGYGLLARAYGVAPATVRDLVKHRTRAIA